MTTHAPDAPSAPDVPSDPASESVARLAVTLHRLDEAHRRYRVRAARSVGIGATELSALLAVSDSPGISPGALSRDLVLSTGTVTAVVDRLETSGHVTRVGRPGDRRSVHLELTDHGTATMATLRGAYRTVLASTGTDEAVSGALTQLTRITVALDAAAAADDEGQPVS